MGIFRLHFVGANGFPCASYAPMLQILNERFTSISNRAYSTVDIRSSDVFHAMDCQIDWKQMIAALIRDIEKRKQPVVGLGHSFGGALLSCAASARPDLFQKLIIVDAPMFNPLKRLIWMLALTSAPDLTCRMNPLIAGARRRRYKWNNRNDAREYLKTRKIFQGLDPRCFDAFLKDCLESSSTDNEAVRLVFQPKWEAAIYQYYPPDLHPLRSRRLGQYDLSGSTGWFLHSQNHELLSQIDVLWLRYALPSLRFQPFFHGHFWPLEHPESFVDTVAALLDGVHPMRV